MYFAIISGLCASLGSFFGKLTGTPLYEGLLIIRIICFGLMLVCNTSGWIFYVKALHNTDSTLSATVVNIATNYISSATIGSFSFDEPINILWMIGALFVIVGVLLVVKDEPLIPTQIENLDSSEEKPKKL